MWRYLKPCVSKAARLRRRIVVEDGRLAHLAELQAHAFAVLEIDRGEEDQTRLVFIFASGGLSPLL